MATLHCQKCRSPLKIDSSLEDLNPASFKILADAAPALEPQTPDEPRSAAARERRKQYDEVSRDAGPPSQKRIISSSKRAGANLTTDMSFVMLSESQLTPGVPKETIQTPSKKKTGSKKSEPLPVSAETEGSYSQQMETAVRLFEILSSRSDIDHPICSECTELVLDGLQKRQASVIRERDAYVEFLKKAQDDVPTDQESVKIKRDLEDVQQREKAALHGLEALEAEKVKLEDEIALLDAQVEELDEEEERFWQERNAFTAELTAYQQERDSLQTQLAQDTKLLEALQRTNVYNDTFAIGHDGLFGTINGLRLGRLTEHPVEWSEINAAWGQALLLLAVVAEKLNYKFKDYKLVPVGSTSKIVSYEASSTDSKPRGTVLELSSGGDWLGMFHAKIDEAMVAFLECLRQLGEHVSAVSAAAGDSNVTKLPYTIHKDKIENTSIRVGGFGREPEWTKACKYTLTCCKFLLAHASHMDDSKSAR